MLTTKDTEASSAEHCVAPSRPRHLVIRSLQFHLGMPMLWSYQGDRFMGSLTFHVHVPNSAYLTLFNKELSFDDAKQNFLPISLEKKHHYDNY